MKLTFWGAARQVTGSMFLLELENNYHILVDCGMDMEAKKEEKPVYEGSSFPFEASTINLVILTHAHLDHSGRIPSLLQEGFEGQILCSSPTLDLAELLLMDAAGLNRKRLQAYHKRRKKAPVGIQKEKSIQNLYLERDVEKTIDQFVPIAFNRKFTVNKEVGVTLVPTGHLLGAANVLLEIKENGESKKILFSGDLGRLNYPLLPDPVQPPEVDYLVCETTYGNRVHTSTADTSDKLQKVIQETCVDIPGRLIIPAFSIGRTQALLYVLNRLCADGKLPPVKIFADSPLAFRSNKVYEKYYNFLNEEAKEFREEYDSLFDFDTLHYVENSRQSRQISNYAEPCIIISSSGMMEGGRIQHHIAQNLENPYCTVMMVGYSAEGTLGNKLLTGMKTVKIGKREVNVSARIASTDAFSGHGDQNDILKFVHSQKPNKLKKLFLVHGEASSMDDFKAIVSEEGYEVETPAKGESFEL